MTELLKTSSTLVADRMKSAAPIAVYYEIQQFMYHEASLLDHREYAAWLELFTEDARYTVTARVIRDASASQVDYAIIDDSHSELTSRIAQISNPRLTRAENPPSFARHLVSNIQVFDGDRSDECHVISAFVTYRGRPHLPEGSFYVGERFDVLRKVETTWRLARRLVRLDQTMVFDGALSVLL